MLISAYKAYDYDEETIYTIIKNIMDEHGILKDLTADTKVLLKPNLVMAKSPDYPITTNPVIVKCVARYLTENGINNITVADSPGGPFTREYLRGFYNTCKMTSVTDYAKLNDDFSFRSFDCPDGFRNHSFNLAAFCLDADYIINLPKLKTHAMTGYSGGIKNLFGCIPGLQKPQMHYRWPDIEDFSNMLVELSLVVNPGFTIIDAIDAMEGNGPTGGDSHHLDMILASKDMYTMDYYACGLMGIEADSIAMIRQAKDRGLIKPDEIEIKGDAKLTGLSPFKKPDSRNLDFTGSMPRIIRRPAVWVMQHVLKSYPKLISSKCVGCGKCAESCPAQIITIKDKKAHFKKKGCISCFCCQEMCPMKAIAVKKAL